MDQKENKLYFSQLSFPESFPESFPSTEAPTVTAGMALAELQNHINELYAKILASQTEMSKVRLFNIDPNTYTLWKEDSHKEFYIKFDKILK